MSLAISARIVSGVIVVDMAGRLCFLDVTLRDRVKEWLQEGHRAFVLNLAGVLYVDSFGLGQLITISNSIRSKGGQLILLNPTEHARALFQITKLNTVFEISEDEAQAVRSMRAKAIDSILHTASAKSHLP
ncbi:MAG TPA: STAS domain-containing protein [Terriglobia bacterium]|nr:STAS domain-containing protein [Terriglobia bacterium]